MRKIKNKEKFLEKLLTPAEPGSEHGLLARLEGDWRVTGTWAFPPTDITTQVDTVMQNRLIMGGLFLEFTTAFEDGLIGSRAFFGYDPHERCYVGFSFSCLTPRIDTEKGAYDRQADSLALEGVEPFGDTGKTLRFRREFNFIASDKLGLRILYPDAPPERRVAMDLTAERV